MLTRAEIMRRAHEIARQMEGDYRARLVYGLRQAWLEHRLVTRFGGRLWEKNGYRRIYLNNLPALYGLKYDTYRTGNISYAELDGEKISNNSARQILFMLNNAKFYYDLATCRFEHKGLSETALERITRRLLAA